MRTSYKRVIPRDLFNEANLLKCWGQLALLLHDRPRLGVEIQEPLPGHPFKIDQNPYDGSISITNMGIAIGGALYSARRPLNSREKWPLQLLTRDDDLIDIFNDDGQLSAEFLAMTDAVGRKPMPTDQDGNCVHCGRDNRGFEDQPCSDECPGYWEAAGIAHPDYPADPNEATGCADDHLPGTAEDWRAGLKAATELLKEANDLGRDDPALGRESTIRPGYFEGDMP